MVPTRWAEEPDLRRLRSQGSALGLVALGWRCPAVLEVRNLKTCLLIFLVFFFDVMVVKPILNNQKLLGLICLAGFFLKAWKVAAFLCV